MEKFTEAVELIDLGEAIIIAFFLFAVGIGGMIQIIKFIRERYSLYLKKHDKIRSSEKSVQAFINVGEIYELLQVLLLKYQAKWSLLSVVENGGNYIDELSEKNLSVIYEVVRDLQVTRVKADYTKHPMDHASLALHSKAIKDGYSGFPCVESIPKGNSMKFVYEEYGINSSYTFYVTTIDKKMIFISLSFDRDDPLKESEFYSIREIQINRLETILKNGR